MATHLKTAARRASRSPLVINISRLGRRPGSMMTFSETVPTPSRIGLDLIGVDEGAPLTLDLRLESVSEGVLVSGTVSAPTSGECARCLNPITGDVEIEQPIIDAIGLALPFSPLCGPDCAGLCPECGVALATAEPGHQHEKIDPRWA